MASLADIYPYDNDSYSETRSSNCWYGKHPPDNISETISHFKPPNISLPSPPALSYKPWQSVSHQDILKHTPEYKSSPNLFNSHTQNVSNFINKQMENNFPPAHHHRVPSPHRQPPLHHRLHHFPHSHHRAPPDPRHQHPSPISPQIHFKPTSQLWSSYEEKQRGFIQESDRLRQKRMEERQKLLQKEVKMGPQYGFGGVSYVPAKPSGSVYRTAPERSRWSANDVKQALLDWCRNRVSGYKNVRIDNFSTSWADGLTFCALIHHFFPQAFDFNSLSPQNRRFNFSLAFTTAEKLANIPAILDVDDMVSMPVPDWKSVFTYLQSFYASFGKMN